MATMKKNPAIKIDRREFLKISSLCSVGILTGLPNIEASTPTADLVLTNGNIITVDSKDSIGEAVVVKGGKILDVGSKKMALQYIGSSTKIVDLKGKTVTPGFIDSHAHLPFFGLRENGWFVKLHGILSKDEILEMLAERVRKTSKGGWISAWGIENPSLSFLDKNDLDRVTTDHPMLVVHTSGQWGFSNSSALRIAGIEQNTPDPPGSKIGKNPSTKEPTGLLIHYPALHLVRQHMPEPDETQAQDALLFAANLYAAEGVTTVHDNFFVLNQPLFQRAYFKLLRSKRMPLRVKIWPYIPNYRAAMWVVDNLFGSGRSEIGELTLYRRRYSKLFDSLWGGFKIAVDGGDTTSLWYDNPYSISLQRAEELNNMFKLFHGAGHQVSIHAAGDKAVDVILDAIETANKEKSRENHRHRIEHAVSPPTRSLERIKRLGVVISTHPQWFFSWGDKWHLVKKLELQGQKSIPIKSYLKNDIPVAMGADPPAFPMYQPQIALWQAGTRTTRGGYRYDNEESISIREALRVQTMGSAYAAFQEKELGSIEKGKLADMVVWDKDFYTISIDQIKDVKALLTIVGGKIFHEKKEG
jgi:predicted amidohydrolase YtcJ